MEWMLLPYRRYFDFAGRSRRREFWLFQLFCALVSAAISIVFGSVSPHTSLAPDMGSMGLITMLSGPGYMLRGVFGLINLVPSLAVSVRRLHDIDRSGWWLLLWLVPVLGWVVLLVFLCLDGNAGTNAYGHDPKGRGMIDVFR